MSESNFWDDIELDDGEQIHHIQVPESNAGDSGIKLLTDRNYYFRCRCAGSIRALSIAKQYIYAKLYDDEGLTGDDKIAKNLSKVPINFKTRCDDDNWGYLWGVSFDLVTQAVAMQDPEYEYYQSWAASPITKESSVDANAVPLLLQYTYPSEHPRRAGETITSLGTITKDVALLTFYKTLVKEMRYPEVATGFISYTNSAPWEGWGVGTLKITNANVKPIYTNPNRDDYNTHVYLITYEIQAKDDGWQEAVRIVDPETGQYPGDVSFDGTIQPGNDYPAGRVVDVLPSFDFNRFWPSTSTLTFQERGEFEFPIET